MSSDVPEQSSTRPITAVRPAAAGDREALRRLFDDARRRLVETGTRNRLVHVNRSNTRGNVLNIVNERSDDVHALLSGGKSMRFLAFERDKVEDRREVVLADVGQQSFDED